MFLTSLLFLGLIPPKYDKEAKGGFVQLFKGHKVDFN